MDAPPKQRSSPFYPDYTTNYGGDVYKGIFLNQNPQFQSDLPIYNVWAGDQQINLGSPIGVRHFYFQNWSATGANLLPFGAGNQSRVVFTSGDAVVQANYKGQGLSNSEEGYANNSQRKFLWTNPGRLHSVYESMGKVWYETSTDNGNTWQIMNNVSPFGIHSSLPAIAMDYNSEYNTFITYRECEDQNCQSSFIKFARFNIPGNNIISEEAVPSVGFGDFATNPVIASGFSQNGPVPHFVLVYEVKSGLYVDPGIYYAVYKKPTIGQYELAIGPTRISGTDLNSFTPTIAVNQSTDAVCKYHVAWEQRSTTNLSRIRYIRLDISGYSNLSASLDGYIENVSYNNGYTRNHKPSIVAYPGNNAKIVWLAERYQAEEEQRTEKGQGADNTEGVQYKTFFKDIDVYGFRSYGNKTNAPTINKLNDNSEYYLAYSEQSNLEGKVVIGSDYTTINDLETIGRDIQMGNGATENQVRALAFHSAELPFYFNRSASMNHVSPKRKSLAIVSGREGVVG